MFDFLLQSENLVFTAALAFMLVIGLIQVAGLGDFSLDFDMDVNMDADVDIDGAGDGMLALLGLGRLPMLMLLVLFLALFGCIGLGGQHFMQSLIGGPLSPWLAIPGAAAAALPLTGLLARPLSRIIPQDETTAVSINTLVGRFAVIQTGTARTGSPARAKVTDVHGQSHYIMVEPDNDGQVLDEGEQVLLTARDGGNFRAISRGDSHVPRLGD